MADSVRELILKNIQTTLQGVTVLAGYSVTMAAVERFLQSGQPSSSVPAVLILEGDDDVDNELTGSTYNLVARTLNVGLMVITRQDLSTDTKSASEVMNGLLADIQKVMQVDPTRGGYALDTDEVSIGPIEAEEGQPELVSTVAYSIRYRHRRTDPTQRA